MKVRLPCFRGAANIDIDKKGDYVSVDIGIAVNDRNSIQQVIIGAIQGSLPLLVHHPDERLRGVKGETLGACLRILCETYARELSDD